MSRYLLLFLLNLPFIFLALLTIVTQYKLGKASFKRSLVHFIAWTAMLAGLILAQPIYIWLFNNKLTNTEPLSLFDVVQITAIVVIFYVINRLRAKTLMLERRLQDLHQELSIIISQK